MTPVIRRRELQVTHVALGPTFQVCASHKLEQLVDENHWEGELQNHDPLFHGQVSELEDHLWKTRTTRRVNSKSDVLHSCQSEFVCYTSSVRSKNKEQEQKV